MNIFMVFLGLLLSLVDVLIHALYAWFVDLIIVLHSLPNQLFLLGLLLLSQYFRCCIHNNIFKSFPNFISSILAAIFQQYLASLFLYNLVHFFNPLKPEVNPICYLLALLGAHHFLHVSTIRVKLLTFRRLMSYIYGAPILDISRSHTTQHSR